jgi:hypothetical protein
MDALRDRDRERERDRWDDRRGEGGRDDRRGAGAGEREYMKGRNGIGEFFGLAFGFWVCVSLGILISGLRYLLHSHETSYIFISFPVLSISPVSITR